MTGKRVFHCRVVHMDPELEGRSRETVVKLARRPLGGVEPGRLDYPAERPAHMRRIGRRADPRRKDQAVLSPPTASHTANLLLPLLVITQRGHATLRQSKRSA